jgi:U6 snRNA-associated Sm-like protein LSm2
MLFFSFFKTLIGQQLTIELKNGVTISGSLISVDQYLNVKLQGINVKDPTQHPQLAALKNCFIRGSVIRYCCFVVTPWLVCFITPCFLPLVFRVLDIYIFLQIKSMWNCYRMLHERRTPLVEAVANSNNHSLGETVANSNNNSMLHFKWNFVNPNFLLVLPFFIFRFEPKTNKNLGHLIAGT